MANVIPPLDDFANFVERFVEFVRHPKYAMVSILWTGWTAWQFQSDLVWKMFFTYVVALAGFLATKQLLGLIDSRKSKIAAMVLAVPFVVFMSVLVVGF